MPHCLSQTLVDPFSGRFAQKLHHLTPSNAGERNRAVTDGNVAVTAQSLLQLRTNFEFMFQGGGDKMSADQ